MRSRPLAGVILVVLLSRPVYEYARQDTRPIVRLAEEVAACWRRAPLRGVLYLVFLCDIYILCMTCGLYMT